MTRIGLGVLLLVGVLVGSVEAVPLTVDQVIYQESGGVVPGLLTVVGQKRTPSMPDLPTIAESGVPGFGVENWYGVFAPGGTSRDIVAKIADVVARSVKDPSPHKMLVGQGLDPVGSTPEEFAKMYNDEIAKWAKVAKAIGLQAN